MYGEDFDGSGDPYYPSIPSPDPERQAGIDMVPAVSMPFTPIERTVSDEREAARRQAQHAFDILLSIVLDTPGSASLDLERLHQEFWASAGAGLREYRTLRERRYRASRDTCGNG